MKLTFTGIVLVLLLLSGCATGTAIVGRDFDSSKISQIQKGVTTSSQIQNLLGEPYKKEVISPTEVKWTYFWSHQKLAVVTWSATSPTTYMGQRIRKALWISIKDDVVVNHTYEEGPF
jgi:outer membrane protein assembly factor BamE (lipoprotein component of BamABCDE complex)